MADAWSRPTLPVLHPAPLSPLQYKRLGYCLPREINRPGGFYPGSSVTCHPTRPITECEVLV